MPDQSTTDGQQVPENSVTIEMPSDQTARQPPGILMTHTTQTVNRLPSQSTMRSSELSRIFPNGVPTNLDDIRPIIAQACSWNIVRLVNSPTTTPGQPSQLPSPPSESFVINVDDEAPTSSTNNTSAISSFVNNQPTTATTTTNDNNFLNNIREVTHSPSTNNTSNNSNNNSNNNNNNNNNDNNNENPDDQSLESLPIHPHLRETLKSIQNHIPFAAVAITKGIYDHRSAAFSLLLLLAVFIKANKDLKGEISKQQRRSRKILFNIILYTVASFAVISIGLNGFPFFLYVKSDSFFDLLWCITVTDFVIKLCTVVIKTLLTFLPASILTFQRRGKYYLLIEAISQFYRATVPMYSWMSYFREAYQGAEVILGILLASFYGATKIRDILCRGKLLINASIKFWQNVSLGSTPTKEQLGESGPICVICHEDYQTPVLLTCKHIFCENCVSTWLDRERTCPLCRAPITDDPVYRDGHTTHFIQLY